MYIRYLEKNNIEPVSAPRVQILRRDKNSQEQSGVLSNQNAWPSKTAHQREEEYAAARKRIFASSSPPSTSTAASFHTHDQSAQPPQPAPEYFPAVVSKPSMYAWYSSIGLN